jgi:hypothetical protein
MAALEDFTHSSHPDHEARCIAIGFCRKGEFLVFNHWRFEKFLRLKRASVDNLIRALGYQSDRRMVTTEIVAHLLPSLRGLPEARNWCVRIQRPARAQAPAEDIDPGDVVAIEEPFWKLDCASTNAPAQRILHPWSVQSILNRPSDWDPVLPTANMAVT